MAAKADLKITQGDDYSAIVTVRNSDGSLANIAAYTASAQIRSDSADLSPLIVSFSASVSSPYVYLSIPHSQTILLTETRYVWDLQLVSSTGIITTIMRGEVFPIAEVTRP